MSELPPPRWYHRLSWWLRTRRPRTSRIVLWGHRRYDRSPRPQVTVTISGDTSRVERELRNIERRMFSLAKEGL